MFIHSTSRCNGAAFIHHNNKVFDIIKKKVQENVKKFAARLRACYAPGMKWITAVIVAACIGAAVLAAASLVKIALAEIVRPVLCS